MVRSPAHPKAALLGFAVMAYNTLSVVQSAVDSKHGINEHSDIALSSFYVANEIKIGYHGMLIAVEPSAFDALERLSTKKLALWLLEVSSHVDPKRFRKQVRGPKPKVKKTYVSSHEATKHVATARVLGKGSI